MVCFVVCSFLSPTELAETVTSGTSGDNLNWTMDNEGPLFISGYGDMISSDGWSEHINEQGAAEAAQEAAEQAKDDAEVAAESVSQSVAQIETNKPEIGDLKSAIGNKSSSNTDAKENLVSAIKEVNEHFLDGIEEGVATWLDGHPEATTTPQDHSLTAQIFVVGTLGFVTPEMYGAIGDGENDDSDAIQNAFNSGFDVHFKENTVYKITKPIILDYIGQRKGNHFQGFGCTIKHESSNAFHASSEINAGLKYCVIEGFNFVSSGKAYDGIYVSGGPSYAGSNYLQECEIKNCSFSGQKYGLYLGGYRITVKQCYFIGCENGFVDDACNNTIIENNFFIGNERGVQLNIPYFTTVINNTFHANNYGIYLSGYESSHVGCTIIGNVFRSGATTPQRHVYIFNAKDVSLNSNFFDANASYAIVIYESNNIIVSNSRSEGGLLLYSSANNGKEIYIIGGYYTFIGVGSVDSDINLYDLTTTIISTNTTLYPRTDRYINAKNVRLVYKSDGTDGRLGSGVLERLKNADISSPTNRYDIKTISGKTYRLQLDNETNTLIWGLIQ